MYPSIGTNCLADGSSAIATALSVAGPAKIPLPGPGAGQTAYVFTAVGTPGPAEVQKLPLNVTWVNLTTGKSGTRHAQAAHRHQSGRTNDVDRDRRHRFGQHHVDDLRAGHHQGKAVPVHAHHRLDGGAVTRRERASRDSARVSTAMNRDRVAVVLQARMNAGKVSLGQFDQLILVLADDGFAARTRNVCLHVAAFPFW